MTTFISLASSATMFPANGTIRTSALTPELVKDRLAKVRVVSALNASHASTIDAIRRRYGLELPLPPPGPAPKVVLQPGDELFIVQAQLPRLAEGEVHSDETVQAAPISFLRWRVPMRVETYTPEGPRGLPQHIFNEIIDHAHSIALWQRGQEHLKDIEELRSDFDAEMAEFNAAYQAWGFEASPGSDQEKDVYLEWADIAYKALCMHYVAPSWEGPWWGVYLLADEKNLDVLRAIDAMLLKYGRRATGAPKDVEAERALIAPLF